jgi:hypothetical protein
MAGQYNQTGTMRAVVHPYCIAGQQAEAGNQHLHEEETTPSGGEYQLRTERSQSLWTFARPKQLGDASLLWTSI